MIHNDTKENTKTKYGGEEEDDEKYGTEEKR